MKKIVRQIDQDEKILTLPDEMIPEHQIFVEKIISRLDSDPKLSTTEYGHAAGTLAQIMVNSADLKLSPEEQRADAREKALKLVERFGPKVKNFLTDELKFALENPSGIESK